MVRCSWVGRCKTARQARLNVLFAPKATELLRDSKTTRWATNRHSVHKNLGGFGNLRRASYDGFHAGTWQRPHSALVGQTPKDVYWA
jgi:hypothetical protein